MVTQSTVLPFVVTTCPAVRNSRSLEEPPLSAAPKPSCIATLGSPCSKIRVLNEIA